MPTPKTTKRPASKRRKPPGASKRPRVKKSPAAAKPRLLSEDTTVTIILKSPLQEDQYLACGLDADLFSVVHRASFVGKSALDALAKTPGHVFVSGDQVGKESVKLNLTRFEMANLVGVLARTQFIAGQTKESALAAAQEQARVLAEIIKDNLLTGKFTGSKGGDGSGPKKAQPLWSDVNSLFASGEEVSSGKVVTGGGPPRPGPKREWEFLSALVFFSELLTLEMTKYAALIARAGLVK